MELISKYIIFTLLTGEFVVSILTGHEKPASKPESKREELEWIGGIGGTPKSDGKRKRQYDAPRNSLCSFGATGQFPYPPDCKRFVNCWKGRGVIQVCSPGTLFNPASGECDYPDKVECIQGGGYGLHPLPSRFPNERPPIRQNARISRRDKENYQTESVVLRPYPGRPPYFGPSHLTRPTQKPTAPTAPKSQKVECPPGVAGLFPHPTDCTQFLNCWGGQMFVQRCGPGTFFNPDMSICGYARPGGCDESEVEVIPEQVKAEQEERITTTTEYPAEHNFFDYGTNILDVRGGVEEEEVVEVTEKKPKVQEEKPKVNEEKPKVNEEKPKVQEEKPKVYEEKPNVYEEGKNEEPAIGHERDPSWGKILNWGSKTGSQPEEHEVYYNADRNPVKQNHFWTQAGKAKVPNKEQPRPSATDSTTYYLRPHNHVVNQNPPHFQNANSPSNQNPQVLRPEFGRRPPYQPSAPPQPFIPGHFILVDDSKPSGSKLGYDNLQGNSEPPTFLVPPREDFSNVGPGDSKITNRYHNVEEPSRVLLPPPMNFDPYNFPPQPSGNFDSPNFPPQPSGNFDSPNFPPQPSGNFDSPKFPPQPSGNFDSPKFPPQPSGKFDSPNFPPQPSGNFDSPKFSPQPSGNSDTANFPLQTNPIYWEYGNWKPYDNKPSAPETQAQSLDFNKNVNRKEDPHSKRPVTSEKEIRNPFWSANPVTSERAPVTERVLNRLHQTTETDRWNNAQEIPKPEREWPVYYGNKNPYGFTNAEVPTTSEPTPASTTGRVFVVYPVKINAEETSFSERTKVEDSKYPVIPEKQKDATPKKEIPEDNEKWMKPESEISEEDLSVKDVEMYNIDDILPNAGKDIRLKPLSSHLDGYIEMKNRRGEWGLVCDKDFGWMINEANIVCRELGYGRGAQISWQGYPLDSSTESIPVSVTEVNCNGNEESLTDCSINYGETDCDITKNAVGLRCFDNVTTQCHPEEIEFNNSCYRLVKRDDLDDVGLTMEEAAGFCNKIGGRITDIISQEENDFLSKWLMDKHPEVRTVLTGGIGSVVGGLPLWMWFSSQVPMMYQNWWKGWADENKIKQGTVHEPSCVVLRKSYPCFVQSEEDENVVVELGNLEPEYCSANYFYWDVEECNKLNQLKIPYLCKKPLEDIGCIVGRGENYSGTASVTSSGLPCLPWDNPEVKEKLANKITLKEWSSKLDGHNFCRNLGRKELHPWCFVEGKENSEYCSIPHCWDSVPGYSKSATTKSTCSGIEFECKPGECISRRLFCDGNKDCSNGRDEAMCRIFLEEFTRFGDKRMKGHGKEQWPGVNENTCAKLCLENKNMKCKSFSYGKAKKSCILSDTNSGLSGEVITAKGWIYYELTQSSVNCSADEHLVKCGNGKCVEVSSVCDGKDNCGDGTDERDCERLGYQIRLGASNETNRGRVEVKVLGKWGAVCDDKFNLRAGEVVCRELGFKHGVAEIIPGSHFPPDNLTILVDDLTCLGNETGIRECSFPGWGKHDCKPEEGAVWEETLYQMREEFGPWRMDRRSGPKAFQRVPLKQKHYNRLLRMVEILLKKETVGVVCRVPETKCPDDQWHCKNSKECIPIRFLCDKVHDCDDGSDEDEKMCTEPVKLRLAGGPNNTAGRLEIRYLGTWGTICDDNFNEAAANVICRIFGYHGPAYTFKNAYFGPGKGPIWLDGVQCFGNETNVGECDHSDWGKHNCKHDEDISISCTKLNSKQKSAAWRPVAASSDAEPVMSSAAKLKSVLLEECSDDRHSKLESVPLVRLQTARVVGSDIVTGGIPWQASIRVRSPGGKSSHWCGAVVVSPYHVLTAGHCMRDYSKSAYFIRVGDIDTEVPEAEEQELRVDHLYIHPEFNKKLHLNNDIALIKVKGEIRLGKRVRPVCVAPSTEIYRAGTNCSISGWGSITHHSTGYARTLRRAYVPILETSLCKAPFVYGDHLGEGMFCAGSLDGGTDSCQGDSGGPMTCHYEGKEYLFGITSWGHGCGRANKPGVYTNVAHYNSWIQEKIMLSVT